MSIEEEIKFNVLNKISLLYNQKQDGLDILNSEQMFKEQTTEKQRHLCASYCYNYTDYELCRLCPDTSKQRNNPERVNSINNTNLNNEPAYVKQFDKLLTQENNTDSVIYNKNDLIPYGEGLQQPVKTITQNGKEYKLYAPYVVIKGE
jgi:hypothetical protein